MSGIPAKIRELSASQPTMDPPLRSVRWFFLPEGEKAFPFSLSEPETTLRAKATSGQYFLAQWNRKRTKRHQPDVCRLCKAFTKKQPSFQVQLSGATFRVLLNPFPLMQQHVTIAYMASPDEPQSYRDSKQFPSHAKLKMIIGNLYSLAERLQGFVVFYNEVGSITGHLHYQAFKAPNFPLPLQVAAALAGKGSGRSPVKVRNYPVSAFRFSGPVSRVIGEATRRANRWDATLGKDASFNLIAAWERGEVVLYLIPRSRARLYAPNLKQAIASLECLGILVLSTDKELRSINACKFDYGSAWEKLASVAP